MEDDDRALWLYTACGLVRIARSEVDTWAAAAEKDKHTTVAVQLTVFDSFDGVRSNLVFHGRNRAWRRRRVAHSGSCRSMA